MLYKEMRKFALVKFIEVVTIMKNVKLVYLDL
ncbi:hypothetical protein J2X97_000593 [Epilithonimonas hungarica]|nr:hypothetical protein [Epilithonimonas hungarica]